MFDLPLAVRHSFVQEIDPRKCRRHSEDAGPLGRRAAPSRRRSGPATPPGRAPPGSRISPARRWCRLSRRGSAGRAGPASRRAARAAAPAPPRCRRARSRRWRPAPRARPRSSSPVPSPITLRQAFGSSTGGSNRNRISGQTSARVCAFSWAISQPARSRSSGSRPRKAATRSVYSSSGSSRMKRPLIQRSFCSSKTAEALPTSSIRKRSTSSSVDISVVSSVVPQPSRAR